MSRNTEATDDVKTWTGGPLNYKEGFFTRLQTDELAKGINEEVVRAISARRNEPQWMLEFRLNAYRAWLEMEEPHWLKAHYDKLNYQDYSYYLCAEGRPLPDGAVDLFPHQRRKDRAV